MSATQIPQAATWTSDQLGEALAALGRRAGYGAAGAAPRCPREIGAAQEAWLESAGGCLGLEIEAVATPYPEVESMLRRAGPAIVRLPETEPPRFLSVVGSRGRSVGLLTPALTVEHVDSRTIRAALCEPAERPLDTVVADLLRTAETSASRERRARAALLEQLLATKTIGGCWLVRPGERAALMAHLGGASFLGRVLSVLGAQFVQYVLFMIAWGLIGWMALADRFDGGWMALWLLLFAVVIPLRLYTFAATGRIAIDLGARLKRCYLDGALNLDPNRIRRFGAGQLLGRILEVEAIDQFTSSGAFYLLIGVSELAFGAIVLALAGGWLPTVALFVFLAALATVSVFYYRARSRWTVSRMGITNAMVEQIVGHRTRLAQDRSGQWVDRDDQALDAYQALTRRMNRYEIAFQTIIPRAWSFIMIGTLIPAFVLGGATTGGRLAAAVGGVLIGFRAMTMIGHNLELLVAALVAWRQLTPLLETGDRMESAGIPDLSLAAAPAATADDSGAILDARSVVYQHQGRRDPVLRNVTLQVGRRDRILLEGPSGEGKSTLASVLAACRNSQSGTVLFKGLDAETIGHRQWRRRVVHVPQFHENHILIGTFAFNALMGRGWPPSQDDLRRATSVCRSLGLGPLIERMPGGLFQMVGETGWQLSHGERSRLFVARAILQDPDVTVLDESLAALDPETLGHTIDYLLESDSAIVMIAHP